jgi:hypothetical protein
MFNRLKTKVVKDLCKFFPEALEKIKLIKVHKPGSFKAYYV